MTVPPAAERHPHLADPIDDGWVRVDCHSHTMWSGDCTTTPEELIAAVEDDDPVIFIEPKRLYNGPFDGHPDRPIVPWSDHPLGEVPDDYYRIPLGVASVRREGGDVTVLAYGTMVYVAEAAADETGVDAA